MFTHQMLLTLVIIAFILMTLMCDSGAILWEEIRCWSLLGFIGLRRNCYTRACSEAIQTAVMGYQR